MKTSQAVAALAALSHEKRLDIYRLLVRRGPQGHPAGVIADKLDIPPPVLTFHAKALEQAGLVQSQQEGRHNIYTANFAVMQALVDFLTAECCTQADGSCATACVPAIAIRKRKIR